MTDVELLAAYESAAKTDGRWQAGNDERALTVREMASWRENEREMERLRAEVLRRLGALGTEDTPPARVPWVGDEVAEGFGVTAKPAPPGYYHNHAQPCGVEGCKGAAPPLVPVKP